MPAVPSMTNSSASSASVGVTGPTVTVGGGKMDTTTILVIIAAVIAAVAIGYKLVK